MRHVVSVGYGPVSIRGALLAALLSLLCGAPAVAQAPASTETAGEDALPPGALFKLSTDRFRQVGEIQDLAYSRDGKKLASVSDDGVILWDAQTGRQLKRLIPRSDARTRHTFAALDISPDGEEIAMYEPSRIYILELESGRELLSIPMDPRTTNPGSDAEIRYSPNGERLAFCGRGLLLFDTATGKLAQKCDTENHRAALYGTCWSPDGKHVAAATLQPAVLCWSAETGEVVRRFESKDGRMFSKCPTISADGQLMLAPTGFGVNVWRFADGELLRKVPVEGDVIMTIVLTPDGKTLVAGTQDGWIRILDAQEGKLLRQMDDRLTPVRTIAVSPDFTTVAVGTARQTIRQWDVATGNEKYPELTATGHDTEVLCVACSPDGRLIASGGANKRINLWDAETGKLRFSLPSQSSAKQVAFTPSGRQLLSSWNSTGMIRVWDTATGAELRTLESGAAKVRGFALAPDGKRLFAIASNSRAFRTASPEDEILQVWDVEGGTRREEFTFQTASTEAVALAPDGTALVTAATNGLAHVLDTATGRELAMLSGHQGSITSLALSPDGALLASAGDDRTIRLWETKTWQPVRVLRGEERPINSIAFSPDGRVLASGSGRNGNVIQPGTPHRIRLWNVDSGEPIGDVSGHDTNTLAVAFAPNGKRLVSGHENTSVWVWDVSHFAGR